MTSPPTSPPWPRALRAACRWPRSPAGPRSWTPRRAGGLGGTYGGNPLGVAAAHAVLDVIEEEDLCGRANVLGARLKQRLNAIRSRVPEMVDVRGPGFMVAAEFNSADGKMPNPGMTNAIRCEALSRGLVLLTCGVHGNVIRFLAPLTIPEEVFAEALDILEASIDAAKGA